MTVFISVPQTYAYPNDDELAKIWAETTNLRAKHIIDFLDDNDCRQRLQTYIGCFQALKVLAQAQGKSLIITTQSIKLNDAEIVKTKKDQSLFEYARERRAKREAEFNAIAHWYNMPGSGPFSFRSGAQALTAGAIQKHPEQEAMITAEAMNAALHYIYDPHTRIEPAKLMEMHATAGDETYVGVGVLITTVDGRLVVNPMENGSAEKAGLKKYDAITAIDGRSVAHMPLPEAVKLLSGKEGTKVRIQVERDGEGPLTFTVTRAKHELRNVESKVVSLAERKIGYIRLHNFMNKNGCNEIEAAIRDLEPKVSGLVLDLRDNSGGLLVQARCIAGLFLPYNSVVTIRKAVQAEAQDEIERTDRQPITNLPLSVLINGLSASASELLAGALQDHGQAWIVGERSFGKGTVQGVSYFRPDLFKGTVLIAHTVQVFHQPSGRTNQIHGIIPDLEVPFKPGATEEERFVMREADIYENAIINENGEWKSPRPQELAKVKSVVSGSGLAEKLYNSKAVDERRDYQLLKSAEVLSCVGLLTMP